MPAVVRVKRRIDEEPVSTLVLGHKRPRYNVSIEEEQQEVPVTTSNGNAKPEFSTILKFAGTIAEQEHSAVVQEYAKISKMEAQQLLQQKTSRLPVNTTEKCRQEMRRNLREQRFQVVNCLRTPLLSKDSESAVKEEAATNGETNSTCQQMSAQGEAGEKTPELTIVDIERHQPPQSDGLTESAIESAQSAQSASLPSSSSTNCCPNSDMGYVYDLYLLENEDSFPINDIMDSHYISVRPFDDLVYEDHYQLDNDDDNESIDSNDENFYANDYPDEDESDAGGYDDDHEEEDDDYEDYENDDDDDDDSDKEDDDNLKRLNGHRPFGSQWKSMMRKDVKKLSKAMTDFILFEDDNDEDEEGDRKKKGRGYRQNMDHSSYDSSSDDDLDEYVET